MKKWPLMNTKLNNMKINPAFEELFSFGSKNERIEHNSQMISFRILSEVEKLCVEKKIKKKELAEMVGTSRSYITQLFRGTKQINTDIMARFEDVLNMHFEVKIKLNDEQRRLNWEVQPSIDLNDLIEKKKMEARKKKRKAQAKRPVKTK